MDKLLVKGKYVVTVNSHNEVIKDGAVFIVNGRIEELGPGAVLEKKFKNVRILDAGESIIMPGLVNAHTHAHFYLLRNLGMDLQLLDWLKLYIWPALKVMDYEDSYWSGLLGYLENIRTGTTCIVDNYYTTGDQPENIDGVAQAFKESKLRGAIIRGYHDLRGMVSEEFLETKEQIIAEANRINSKWNNGNRFKIAVAPVNLLFSAKDTVAETGKLMAEWGLPNHTHVAESQSEVEHVYSLFGAGYVDTFNQLGLLGPNFHSVHSVCLTEVELELLKANNSVLIHNPTSNMVLSSGIAPIQEAKNKGILIALGTDSLNRQDMFEIMKVAALLLKVSTLNPTGITAREVLRMATINGAKSLGLDKEIGSLEVGKKADITILKVDKPHHVPLYDPISTIVYSASGQDVETVLIEGEVIYHKREYTYLNPEEILSKIKERAEALMKRIS
ncbi:MAG: amidohydrolase family protein [Zhaonellaceae bacterium]|jgi:5-methylthioadenosine/S-adenosylhomocysteine deaminase|nr:amidohydrolase [Clostridia bacterium]